MIANFPVWGKVAGLPKFEYTGTYEYIDDGGGNWRIKFLTSGVLTLLTKLRIDAFLVGGGAGGTGGGGGGGYTNTVKNIELPSGGNYDIIIGAGGAPEGNGGETSGFGLTAAGGSGKNGGSGGGAFGMKGGGGGSDGSNGDDARAPGTTVKGGTGQGTTTREFGEASGELYSGGGGGGGNSSGGLGGLGGGGNGAKDEAGGNGQENTGGGGGGTYKGKNGGYGGSGIFIIRNAR